MKTVLTFGDRPAPTMAITAMRKTAKRMQDVKPTAAAVNAYEGKTLTSDVDEVLVTGGFQVKKWTSNVALDSKESSEEVVLGGETHSENVLGTV